MFATRSSIEIIASRAIVALMCSGALVGCRTLSRQNPAPQAVATCRQLTQQGASAMERGDWKRAESLLSRAVTTNGADVDARRNYAASLEHRGALPEALAQLGKARALAGEDPDLAVRTGAMHLALGQTQEAARMVEASLELDPKFAGAWVLRGRVATAAGQHREALADYQRALGYAPDDMGAAILVAEAYRALNEPQRALVALQAVADRHSRGEEPQRVMYLQGVTFISLGRYDEAANALAQATRRDRPTAEILCRLAEAELLAGRAADAQANVQTALALDPNHAASRALSMRLAMAAAPGAAPERR